MSLEQAGVSADQPATPAEIYLQEMTQRSLTAEAEDLAHGVRHLSIATGDLETAQDVARVEQLTAVAWAGRAGARMKASRGGNDYLTFVIEGPDADTFVDELAALAESINPGFWRITLSANPF